MKAKKTTKLTDKLTDPKYAYDRVFVTAAKAHEMITYEFGDATPQQRWLLYGRVVSILFSGHYKMSIDATQERIKKK